MGYQREPWHPDAAADTYHRELREARRENEPVVPNDLGRVRWEPWAEHTCKQDMRMSDGTVVPAGQAFMVRHRRVGTYITATEVYSIPDWVARKIDNNDFMGEWFDNPTTR